MDQFLIIYKNIYIRNIINSHLRKYYYNNRIEFKNVKSFIKYSDKEYISNLVIVHQGNQDLEVYFEVISSFDNIKNIQIYQDYKNTGVSSVIANQIVPSSITSIVFENHQYLDLASFQFSSSLKKIRFGIDSKYNSEITYQALPDSLKKLTLGVLFNKSASFPSNLSTLKFNSYYNQPIEANLLPKLLKKLVLGTFYQENDFSQILKVDCIPNGLTSLSIGHYYCHIGKGVLPDTISKLKIGYMPQDISDIIPSSCTSLYIHSNQIISSIPSSLTELRFAYSESHCERVEINANLIPNTIRILELSAKNILVGDNRLPPSITELVLEHCDQELLDNYLPISKEFKKLLIYNNDTSLEFREQHHSIVDLDIGRFITSYETLPPWLSRFEFSCLITNLKNVNLKSILRSLLVLKIHLDPESFEGDQLFPDSIVALSFSYRSNLNSILFNSSIQILEIYNCFHFKINNQFLQQLPSLNHLILLDCYEFEIINPDYNSNVSIYLDGNSFNVLKQSHQKLDYLNDIFFNLKLITLNDNQDLFKKLINKKGY